MEKKPKFYNRNQSVACNVLGTVFYPVFDKFLENIFYSNRIDEKNIFNDPLGCNLWFREKIMNEDSKFPILCHPICAGSSNSCYSRKIMVFWLSDWNQILVLSVLEV